MPHITDFFSLCHVFHQLYSVRVQSPQDCPHFRYQPKVWSSQDHPHFRPAGYKFRGTHNHPQVWSFEWLTKLRSVILIVLLQQSDTNSNQPREGTHRAESSRGPNMELPAFSFHGVTDSITSSQLPCVTIHTKYCQPGKLTWVFGVLSFYWGSITYCSCGWPLVSSYSQRSG